MPTETLQNNSGLFDRAALADGWEAMVPAAKDDPRNRNPRVLFVATALGEGGIERHSIRLAERLVECGVDISYACSEDSFLYRQCKTQGIDAQPLHCRNSGDIGAIFCLAKMIEDYRTDVVHVHSRRDFVTAAFAVMRVRARGKCRQPRLILHSHLDKPLGQPAGLSRRLFGSVGDCVVAVSQAVKDHLIDEHGFGSSFIHVLYNGIDVDAFVPAGTKPAKQRRAMMRKSLEIPADALVIGMLGRLNAKGQAELLSAAAPLIRTRRSIKIVLVGPEGRPGDMNRLREITVAEGIVSNVIITGSRNDVPDILPAFDVLVHLPQTESFGLALVEAMASGLPTITANVGGCVEVVMNDITGVIVPVREPFALQAALRRLLLNDGAEQLRSDMGKAGRKIACGKFSIEQQTYGLACLYRDLAKIGNE